MSARQVAFLRSINVGGRRVKNAELIEILEGLGLEEVAAYQAAGNLIFTGDIGEQALAAGLTEALGYEVPVLIRSLTEVGEVANCAPFSAAELEASTGKIQVSLLATAPNPAAVETVLSLESDEDRLRIVGRELYWLPLGKMSDSELNHRPIDRALGLRTTRTQGTLQRLFKRFG